MDFTVCEETTMLRETLRKFLTEEVVPLERARNLGWDVAPPKELRRLVRLRSKELGLYALEMPHEVGGADLPFLDRCILEMDAHVHDTVFFEDVLGGGCGPNAILTACTPVQRERFLDPLLRGEVTTCLALSEPAAGSDATAITMRAERRHGGFVLNGTKNIISNAVQADFVMAFAVTDPALGAKGGVTCFLVDKDTPGLTVGRVHTCMGFTGYQGELVFDECEVPVENVVGPEGFGLVLALDWINGNRLRTAAMAAGITRRLLARSTAYATERRQFVQAIANFQLIQCKLADMATELYAAENMILRTAWMRDRRADVRKESAMTKLYCSELVNRAAYEAIQIHGGVGCLAEAGIERVYRMVRILTILEGTSEMQRLTIAQRLLKERAV